MIAVKMANITKSFPGVVANDHITFEVEARTVNCLLGENGSGKTTLMNILFGLYKMDSGQIFIHDVPVKINNPADAERLGIGMVHQHFMLINQLTVWENIVLGKESGKFIFDRKASREKVLQIVQKYDFKLDIDQKIADLSIGMKQRTEIIKLLYKGMNIIIFDEPTAVLTPQESDDLFSIFRQLVQQGKTIIFISHKLNEIFDVSEYVTVLRKGKNVGRLKTVESTPEALARLMVGHPIENIKILDKPRKGAPVLELRDVILLSKGSRHVNIQVHAGEIVGVAGVEGNGQMELEELVIGTREVIAGEVIISGQMVNDFSPSERKLLGIGYIPSDRSKNGVMVSASVLENFLLGYQDTDRYRKGLYVNYEALERDSEEYISNYDIQVASIKESLWSLSGGNQQKLVLAREVEKPVNLIVAAQPIRGLDVGAIEYVHKVLLRLRMEGKGILLISTELSELLDMSDKIVVLHDGRITGTFIRKEFSEKEIGLCMMGQTKK